MKRIILFTLFSFLAMSSLVTPSYAVHTEGICADITHPLNGCDALHLCPDLCKLYSQVWTGNFGTSTNLCEDQQKEGNAICECTKE